MTFDYSDADQYNHFYLANTNAGTTLEVKEGGNEGN